MKTKTYLIGILGLGLVSAQASLFVSGTLNAAIPDNDPSGYVNSIAVSGLGSSLQTISVNLSVSDGYNGDLYAYLIYNGTAITLLNRVGTGIGNIYGYADTGFTLTLNDGGTPGLHNYQANGGSLNGGGQLTGTWHPDAGGLTFATQYGGIDPNGTWSLFFADLSPGSQSTLTSWSLDITAVPEPVNVALGIFVSVLLTVSGLSGFRYWGKATKCS